jgi:hypothetical protein
MKLSEALRTKICFDIRVRLDGTKFYTPFGGCVQAAFGEGPDWNLGEVSGLFPLAFACPLFVGDTEFAPGVQDPMQATRLVTAELPAGCHLPQTAGIYFLADCIDVMAVKLGMSESQVADVVERIENQFEAHGLYWDGLPVGRATS